MNNVFWKSDYFIVLKVNPIISCIISVALAGCVNDELANPVSKQTTDTIPPTMTLVGKTIDTAYLQADYKDPGVILLDNINGQLRCSESISLEVTGEINNRLPGTYTLTYNAKDRGGNQAATLTRTVHVVENSAAFLSGNYNVTCTCSAFSKSSTSPTVTTNNYTAVIKPGSDNRRFELVSLDIGPEKLVPYAALNGNSITVDFWNAHYARSSCTGSLSLSKNTFTIESTVYPFSPALTYKCKNIYSRSLNKVEQDTQ